MSSAQQVGICIFNDYWDFYLVKVEGKPRKKKVNVDFEIIIILFEIRTVQNISGLN